MVEYKLYQIIPIDKVELGGREHVENLLNEIGVI